MDHVDDERGEVDPASVAPDRRAGTGVEVLVAHASVHGSTADIAGAIGARLGHRGLRATVLPVADIETVAPYGAVVLGSAVHDGAWLTPASGFAHTHAHDLRQRPVWLFSVSSVGDTTSVFRPGVARILRRLRRDPKGIPVLRDVVGARGHRNFAGVIRREHWGRAGTVFVKALGGRYGDHRDRGDIDAWADEIARVLRSTSSATRT